MYICMKNLLEEEGRKMIAQIPRTRFVLYFWLRTMYMHFAKQNLFASGARKVITFATYSFKMVSFAS